MHVREKDLFSDSYVTKYSCNDLQISTNQYGKTEPRKTMSKNKAIIGDLGRRLL